jgi:hypothetical protein
MAFNKDKLKRIIIFILLSSLVPIIVNYMGIRIAHDGEIVLLLLMIICPTLVLNFFLGISWIIVVFINGFYLEGIYRLYLKIKKYTKEKKA